MDKLSAYLKIAIIVALLAGSYAVISYVDSYGRGAERSFAVSGEGKVVAVPDLAVLYLQVITEGGKDLKTLQISNTNKMNKVIEFVRSKGVEKKDVRTSNYQLTPRYQNYACSSGAVEIMTVPSSGAAESFRSVRPCPPAEIVGYQITQTLEIKVRKFEDLGTIIEGATSAGVNSVTGPNFTVDDPSLLQAAAKGEAIKQARTAAEVMAKTGGFRLGRLISIDENGPFYGYGRGGAMDVAVSKIEQAPAPIIEPGSQEYRAVVTLRFEIK